MFEIKKVEPIGERTSRALVKPSNGPCELRDVTEPTYPPSPQGENLRRTRVAMSKNLRDVSRALGISAENLSGLEHARYTFVDPADWDRALDIVRASVEEKPEPRELPPAEDVQNSGSRTPGGSQ